ncbi:hypothetical protein Tco_0760371 [Tanacetum coccineum]
MAIMNSCNKHNMIACVEKTERNADFHEVIDFLTGCCVNYALLVSPDVTQQWIQQFWSTAKVRMINEVAHIEAKVAGKKILVSEASVRTDLMFNDEDGTNCFDNQTSYKSEVNFSKLIFDGMLRNLKDSKPFLMYPRFIQLFLNKQLEGITKPQNFLPTVVLPSKVFTFMSKCSPKFSGKLTPLTPHMLEVANAVRAEHSLHTEELDIPTSSHHSDDSSASEKAKSSSPVASERPTSPNDYTPTDEVLRLKKQNTKQAAQILRLKTKIKILVKQVKPLIAEYRSFVKINATLSKKKKLKKAHKKKSSSFKQGRKKVSDGSTGLNEVDVNSGDSQVNEGTAQVFEGTAEVIEGTEEVHEGTAQVHESTAKVNESTAEVHESTAEVNESTAGANLSTEPSMKEVEDEAGPSTFQDESDEFIQDDTLIADLLVNISRPRRGAGITIPGNIPEQERPKSPTLILDPKDKEVQSNRKREFTEEQKAKFLLRNQMMKYIRNVGGKAYRNLKNKSYEEIRDIYEKVKRFNDKFVAIGSTEDEQAIKEMNVKAEEPSKKRKGIIRKMKSSRIIKKRKIQKSDDELKDFLKVVNFKDDYTQDVEVMEQHSVISRFSIVQSPESLILHGDLTTMMETTEESDDELWRNQTEWEIISWRFYESTGVHILELENGTMIHMLVEQRFCEKQKEDLEREEE